MKIVDESSLDRFRGPGWCEHCRKHVARREPHHIWARGTGGGGRLDVAINLIALCAVFTGGENCHDDAHNGKIPRATLILLAAAREGISAETLTTRIYELRRLRKGSPLPDWMVTP